MSHFTVLVIGNNPEGQLAPYDESIETAPVNKGEVSQEEKDRFLKYYQEESESAKLSKDIGFDEAYELHGEDWNGNTWEKEGGVWCEFSTYNPHSKWDWYKLGGRWTGFFKVKSKVIEVDGEILSDNKITPAHKVGSPGLMTEEAEEGYGDSLMKRDIDIEGMRDEKGQKASEYYDKIMKIVGHLPKQETWDSVRKKFDTENNSEKIDEAREYYGNQERVKALRESKEETHPFLSLDDFLISKEEYVQNARNNALITFAVVKDGKWYEKGEMGWWAFVSNEKEAGKWEEEFNKLFDDAPDDTIFSVYDCHI